MIEKRWARQVGMTCIGCVMSALIALPSPAVAKKRTKTFNRCVSAAANIPDGPPENSAVANPAAYLAIPVRVPKFKGRRQNGVITAVHSTGVRISHTDDGDLAVFLVSPGGRAAALATFRDQSTNEGNQGNPSPSGDGYGTGPPGCSGSLVQFGDAFPTPITRPGNSRLDAPITGSFTPEQPLSTFVGGPARGFWTLIVQDVQEDDVGQINALSLNFTYRYKVKRKRR